MNTVQSNKGKVFEGNAKRYFNEESCNIIVSELPVSDMIQGQILIPYYQMQNAVAYMQQHLAIQNFIMLMVGSFSIDMSSIKIATSKSTLCITLTF